MFQFHPIGFLALVAVLMCWVLGVVLYRVGAPGSVARKLSVLMAIEGITLISTGYIDLLLTPGVQEQDWFPKWIKFEEIVHTLGDCAMLALYPSFLAAALKTSLTRPFGRKRIQVLLVLRCQKPITLPNTPHSEKCRFMKRLLKRPYRVVFQKRSVGCSIICAHL